MHLCCLRFLPQTHLLCKTTKIRTTRHLSVQRHIFNTLKRRLACMSTLLNHLLTVCLATIAQPTPRSQMMLGFPFFPATIIHLHLTSDYRKTEPLIKVVGDKVREVLKVVKASCVESGLLQRLTPIKPKVVKSCKWTAEHSSLHCFESLFDPVSLSEDML